MINLPTQGLYSLYTPLTVFFAVMSEPIGVHDHCSIIICTHNELDFDWVDRKQLLSRVISCDH